VAAGDLLQIPNVANILEQLAEAGPELFYRGELGQQLVQDCEAQGGLITQADLEQYAVVERSPLSFTYQSHQLLTNPPPSSGGALIAFALALLEEADLRSFGSTQHLTALVQAMGLTNLARKDGYDAQIYDPDVAERFLSQPHLQQYHSQMVHPLSGGLPPDSKLGSTTHISVIDGEGNAASVTASNGEGSGYVIPGTGIMLNNMLGEADLNPQGFHQWQPNRRLSSMMAPTLVIDRGQPRLCLGSGGSNRIRTAILQVLLNKLNLGMSLAAAVAAPRVHWEDEVLNWEPGFDAGAIARASTVRDTVIPWSAPNMFFGGVHGVGWDGAHGFEAVGDLRRCGAFEIA
jgi:gamma-glutamyltranspeptidase / glutathione hydrolase